MKKQILALWLTLALLLTAGLTPAAAAEGKAVESIRAKFFGRIFENCDKNSCVLEKSNGERQAYREHKFYNSDIQLTVNYTNGSTETKSLPGEATLKTGEGPGKEWKANNTYPVTVCVYGKECVMPVKVEASPIKSVQFQNYEVPCYPCLTEHTTTLYRESANGEITVYRDTTKVQWAPLNNITLVELQDGTTFNNYDDALAALKKKGILPNGYYMYPKAITDQNCYNIWQPGKHCYQIEVLGFTANAEVTVLESPIETMRMVDSLKLYEGVDEQNSYNGRYTLRSSDLPIEIVTKTGQVVSTWSELDAFGVKYGSYPDITPDSNYYINGSWKIGTHSAMVEYLGKSAELTVEVLPNPVQQVEVTNSLEFTQGIGCQPDGLWYGNYVGNETYNIGAKDITVRVTATSGEAFTGTVLQALQHLGLQSQYQMEKYCSVLDEQYQNPLQVGQNTVKLRFFGKECNIPVTLKPTPAAAVIVTPLQKSCTGKNMLNYKRYKVTVTYRNAAQPAQTFTGTPAEIYNQCGVQLYFKDHYSSFAKGSNTETANFMGVSAPVEFEAANFAYTGAKLQQSSEAGPVLTLTGPGGLQTECKIQGFYEYGDSYFIRNNQLGVAYGELITDRGTLSNVKLHWYSEEREANGQYEIFDDYGKDFYLTVNGVKTNTLQDFCWNRLLHAAKDFTFYLADYPTESYRSPLKRFAGTVTAQNLDQLIYLAVMQTVSTSSLRQFCANGGAYYAVPAQTVQAALAERFGLGEINLTKSSLYNAESNTLTLYPGGYGITYSLPVPQLLTAQNGRYQSTISVIGSSIYAAFNSSGKILSYSEVLNTAGDLDQNGEKTLQDAFALARVIAGCTPENGCPERYDCNGDGLVDLKDVVSLMRQVLQ